MSDAAGLPEGAQAAAATIAATGAAAAVALAAAPDEAPQAAANAIITAAAGILAAFDAFLLARREEMQDSVDELLTDEHPDLPEAERWRLIDVELQAERAYAAAVRERLDRDLPPALALEPDARAEAVRRILARERRVQEQREAAIVARLEGAANHHAVKVASPEGAYWRLNPKTKAHTIDAVMPWSVLDGPPLTAAARRWWEGSFVEAETESGALLAVTPKHPVLTHEGWLAAGSLDEGDYLVRHLTANQGASPALDDVDHVPALAQEVFGALSHRLSLRRGVVPIAPEDFHGDGHDGYVDVVWADRPLRGWAQSTLSQGLEQRALARGGGYLAEFSCQRRARLRGNAVSAVGRYAPQLHASGAQAVRERGSRYSQAAAHGQDRLAALVGGDERVGHGLQSVPSQHDASPRQRGGDRFVSDAKLVGQLLRGCAGPVALDKIVRVRRVPYAGHVYDLSTVGAWYTADSLVVHNCMAMGGKAWPWSILDVFHPPLCGPWCACELWTIDRAVRAGLIERGDIQSGDRVAAMVHVHESADG